MRRSSYRRGAPFTSGLSRFVKYQGRSLCASALAVSMVVGLTGPGFQAQSTDSSSLCEYEFDSEELYWALQDAIAGGGDFDPAGLEFSGAEADAYGELFDADGQLYKLNVDVQGQSENDDLTVAVYAKLNGDSAQLINDLGDQADSRYQVTGEEELIFLLENRSDAEQTARIVIDGVPSETIAAEPYGTVTAESAGPAENENPAAETETAAESTGAEENMEDSAEVAGDTGTAEENTDRASGAAAESEAESLAREATSETEQAAASEPVSETEKNAEAAAQADASEALVKEEAAEDPETVEAAEETEAEISGEQADTEETAEADVSDGADTAEEAGEAEAEVGEPETTVGAAVSYKKVARVTASVIKASASNAAKTATASDAETATDSNAEEATLDGETYASVALKKHTAAAYVIGADALGMNRYNEGERGLIFEAKLDGVYIKVKTPLDAFKEKVKLVVAPVDSDKTEEAEALVAEQISYRWIGLFDVHFENAYGEEAEPNTQSGPVEVYADLKGIPEDADAADLKIFHLPETGGEIEEAEEVAKTAEDQSKDSPESGEILVDGDQLQASFSVDSFSTLAVVQSDEGIAAQAEATVTIAQGGNGEISNVPSHKGWWAVDSDGVVVSGITVTQKFDGDWWSGWTYYLTVSASESVTAGTYRIMYENQKGEWINSVYTVEVTEATTWGKRIENKSAAGGGRTAEENQTYVEFFVQLNSKIIDSSQDTPTSNYTSAVFNTEVSSHPDNFDYTESAGEETQVLISGSTATAYNIDETIRTLGTDDGYTASYNGENQSPAFKLTDFPTDETVLKKIKESKKEIKINGKVINNDNLTTDYYAVRWYVFKHSGGSGWHIDGILVPKYGRMTVTKTFNADTNEGLKGVLNSVYDSFTITASGTRSSDNLKHEAQLKLSTVTTKDNIEALKNTTVTYTWTTDVLAADYTITETGTDAENYTLDSAKYTKTEDGKTKTAIDTLSDKGFTMTCTTRAEDAGTTKQSCALTNTYIHKPVTLTLTKKVKGNMGDTSKEFTFTVSTNTGTLAVPTNGNATLNSDGRVTAQLHNDEAATITVPSGADITITEPGGGDEEGYKGRLGYTTTYKVDNATTGTSGSSCIVSKISADTSVEFTNTKDVTIDTNALLGKAPFFLIAMFALMGVTVAVQKRRGED